MSGHGTCLNCDHPAVAWLHLQGGFRTVRLCRLDLDTWFDTADDHPDMEPRIWGWFAPPAPASADITAWASDPRNHRVVAAVLRRETRINPSWLQDFVRREQRAGRTAHT